MKALWGPDDLRVIRLRPAGGEELAGGRAP